MLSFQLLLSATGLLLGIGLTMVFSASSVTAALAHRPAWAPGVQQAIWACLGLGGMVAAMRIPTPVVRRWSGRVLLVMVLLLVAVLVPGVGVKVFGARKWFNLGVGYLQPSEVAKIVFGLWGAHLIALRDRYLTTRLLIVPVVPAFAVIAGLIVVEPDLGTTVTLLLVLIGLLWAGGARKGVWLWLAAVLAAAITALVGLAPYRAARFTSFLDPFADPTGDGFQEIRGLYALASGGFWGHGLGNSRMKWGLLPNAQSDYIFAILGEELGFLGCLVVIVLYGVLAYAGFRIAARSADRFTQIAATALTILLVGQAVMNMGYVVGILPVTGVTLPLISQGGTSLVLTLVSVGLLARFARAEPDALRFQRAHPTRGRLTRWLLPLPVEDDDRTPSVGSPAGRDRRPAPPPGARPPDPATRPAAGTPPTARSGSNAGRLGE